jgi:signal transduction histidine kinase
MTGKAERIGGVRGGATRGTDAAVHGGGMAAPVDRRERRRLRLRLLLFFCALALPSAGLLLKALDQLKWEALRQSQLAAEALSERINTELTDLIRRQNARPFDDFSFLVLAGDPAAGFVQRSALSAFPVEEIPAGLIGWFQIDASGRFSTPLLPRAGADVAAYGITAEELAGRQVLEQRIAGILDRGAPSAPVPPMAEPPAGVPPPSENAPASTPVPGQRAFDLLSEGEPAYAKRRSSKQAAGAVADVASDMVPTAPPEEIRQEIRQEVRSEVRSEVRQATRAEAAAALGRGITAGSVPAPGDAGAGDSPRAIVRTFQSELAPFRFSRLDDEHFVLFRWAWSDGARFVQGALIDADAFLGGTVGNAFRVAAVSDAAELSVYWGGEPMTAYRAAPARLRYSAGGDLPAGTVIHRERLREPFGALQLVFAGQRLPRPPGAPVVYWLGAVLAVVLCVGTWLLYRLGLRQLALVRQQQDFVAAVSHELKTPLTSIRMYSEMLREGWVGEHKRAGYYRFIHDESERLSRLVENVLQLARMSRNALRVAPRPMAVVDALQQAAPTLESRVRQSGFTLRHRCGSDRWVRIDPDALTQILLNLVDNAVKFSADAPLRNVDLLCADLDDGGVEIRVRDYGPGIPRAERERVFELFRRLDDGGARAGTGIGLALVRALTETMAGTVAIGDAGPGTEVRLCFAGCRRPA